MFTLDGLDHVALTVRDVARSIAWYQEVLGLERAHEDVWGDIPVFVLSGSSGLALFPVKGADPNPRPGPDTISIRHVAFRASRSNFEEAQDELRRRNITFKSQDSFRACGKRDGHAYSTRSPSYRIKISARSSTSAASLTALFEQSTEQLTITDIMLAKLYRLPESERNTTGRL